MKLSTFLSESELKSLTKINSEDNQQSSGMPAWYEKEKRNSLSLQAATKEKKKLQDKKMRHAIRTMKEDEVDTVTMDIPLLLRIMEYAREDAREDMDLHDVAEKMIELSKSHEYLCMDNYDEIIGNIDEAGMPSSVIKHKQKMAEYTPEQLLASFTNVAQRFGEATPAMLEKLAREMAWRHGYGRMSDHYWKQISHLVNDDVTEAGPFSYGKKPRKGTVAYNAAQQRKKDEKNKKPIEPKDQMVGNAKITKDKKVDESEKQKGLDGKACWDGYKRMGTKMKGGKRVDNCVPIKKGK